MDLFYAHALIAGTLDWDNLPADVVTEIWTQIDYAETNGDVQDVALPADYPSNRELYVDQYKSSYQEGACEVTRNEWRDSYAARVAHSLYHEINGTFSWRIGDYDANEMYGLLGMQNMSPTYAVTGGFDWDDSDPICYVTIVSHSPSDDMALATTHLLPATSHKEAISNLMDFLETTRHSTTDDPLWCRDAAEVIADEDRVARRGCHSTQSLSQVLCHAINIPVRRLNGYFQNGHSQIRFESIGQMVLHADMVYEFNTEAGSAAGTEAFTSLDDAATLLAIRGPLDPAQTPEEGEAILTESMRLQAILQMRYISEQWEDHFTTYQEGWPWFDSVKQWFDLPTEQWRFDDLYRDLVQLTGTDGYPTTDSSNRFPMKSEASVKRYYDTVENVPLFMLLEDASSAVAQLDATDRDTYLDSVLAAGFIGVKINAPEKTVTNHTPTYTDDAGNQLFNTTFGYFWPSTEFGGGTPNDYWVNVLAFTTACLERNLLCVVNTMYAGTDADGWLPEMQRSDNVDQVFSSYAGWVKALISAGNKNVFGLVGGDITVADMATGTPTTVETRITKMTDLWGSGTGVSIFAGAAGQTTDDYYDLAVETEIKGRAIVSSDGVAYDEAQTEWESAAAAPVFLLKGIYENSASPVGDDLFLRRQHYLALLNGAVAGAVYGNRELWSFGVDIGFGTPDWQAALDDPGRVQMIHIRKLLESRQWWKLEPSFDASIITTSRGTSGLDWTTLSLTTDARTLMLYTSHARAITLDLSVIAVSSEWATCWWYDPSDGSATLIGYRAPAPGNIFTHPGNNAAGDPDWVLVCDDDGAGFPAPGL